MSNEAESGSAVNRLPWVGSASSSSSATHHLREFTGWIVAAALLVGGGAYWLAVKTGDTSPQAVQPSAKPSSTAELPAPVAEPKKAPLRPTTPASKVATPADSRSTATTRVAYPSPPASLKAASAPARTAPMPKAKSAAPAPKRGSGGTAPRPAATHSGNILATTGATGAKAGDFARPGAGSALGERLVQLAAFRDLADAKPVWRRIERSYPAMKQFHPSLIQNRDSTGQPFYQFEVGTASQADSEMLCQSMERAKFGCTIVELSGR